MAYKYSSSVLLKKLGSLLYEYKYQIILIIFLIIISTIALIWAPRYLSNIMGYIEDCVYGNITFNIESCYPNLVSMTLLYIFSYVIKYFLSILTFRVSEDFSMKLKNILHEKINLLPSEFFRSEYSGNLVSVLNKDIGNINTMLKTGIISFVTNILIILFVILVTLAVNMELSLLFVVITVIYMIILNVLYIRTRNNFLIHQDELGEMMGFVSDFLPKKLIVQSFNSSEYFKKQFKIINDKQRKSFFKSTLYTELFYPLTTLLIYLIQIGLYFYAAYLLYHGRIDVEVLTIFVIYVQLFKKSILSMAGELNSIQKGFASFDRVLKIIEYPVREDDSELLVKDNVKGEIEFKDVSYGKINNFNLKIEVGEVINIVGKNSNTIIDLLLSLITPKKGEILLDGININKINSVSLRSIFGVSIDEDYIFFGSIMENLTYGMDEINYDKVIKTCEAIGLDKLVQRYPEKYDTLILDDYHNLSSGERKLICVARALLSDTDILILNYPNYLSQNTMKDICKNKTVILLTPDVNSINFADKTIQI